MSDRLKLELRRSEIRQRLGEIAGTETLTDELRTEAATLQTEMGDLEIRYRAAVQSEEEAQRQAGAELPDAEMRERIELRGRARLTEYLRCRAAGTLPAGAEAELQAAAGVTQIPLELWDVPGRGTRARCRRAAGYHGCQSGHDPAGRVRQQHCAHARH